MIKVSVIVPVYNVEKYLHRCIDSILNQTFRDFEIILINDGSTDGSGKICNDYQLRDSRIQVINKQNGGLSEARNFGIKVSKGDYLCFIDSDDYIHPRMIEILFQDIKKNEADISCCNFLRVKENETVDYNSLSLNSNEMIYYGKDLIACLGERVELVIACNKLYKKELFNDIKYKVGVKHEDEYIIHHLLLKCEKFVFRDCILYYYLQREGSIMDLQKKMINIDKLLMYRERWKYCSKFVDKEIRDKLGYTYINYFFNQYKKHIKIKDDKITMTKYVNMFKIDLLKSLFNYEYNLREKIIWILFILNQKSYNNFLLF